MSHNDQTCPVTYPFKPGKDILPGKGEWFKRNNKFFRDKVGELSDSYDECTKVSEKREIAKMVVDAVHARGGKFLDAYGRDVGWRKSMDKAMKALKDRRHIKARKTKDYSNITPRAGTVRELEATSNLKKSIQGDSNGSTSRIALSKDLSAGQNMSHKTSKDPLTTDDAGLALMLLRNAKQESKAGRSEVDSFQASSAIPRSFDVTSEGKTPSLKDDSPRPGKKMRREVGDVSNDLDNVCGEGGLMDAPRCSDVDVMATLAAFKRSVASYQTNPGLAQAHEKANSSVSKTCIPETVKPDVSEQAKQVQAPLLWQSVIVSRECPQASLADMLVNAKERLEALSSIQQAVSAPICLIYPPSPNFNLLQSQVSLQEIFQGSFQNRPT